MSGLIIRNARRAFQSSLQTPKCKWLRTQPARGLATETATMSANLPLAGIKVLDMTRVLAGVSVT